MKINGPNQTNFNPYKNHIQKQADIKNEVNRDDQLEISSQAKKLQESEKPSAERLTYLQEIKKDIETGDYKVDTEKLTDAMIAFWSKK